MIVKMKKLILLCTRKETDSTLRELRSLGAVHVEHVKTPKGTDVEKARNDLKYVRQALELLPHGGAEPSGRDGHAVIEDIWKIIHERSELEEHIEDMRHERKRILPFGDFDPETVKHIEADGLKVCLCKTGPKKERPATPDGSMLTELSRDKDGIYYALIAQENVEIDAHPVRLPSISLTKMEEEIAAMTVALEENAERLESYAGDRVAVENIMATVEENLTYLETRGGMGVESEVAYLRGYLPVDRVDDLVAVAAERGWGYRIDNPAETDKPPTLIRNPRWINIIRPVFDFMGISPGYNEVDISLLFLVFLSIFFGMIVGDAGYGALFLATTLLLRKKMRTLSPLIVPLLVVMSVCTIIWGVLQGQYFSMNAAPAVFEGLKVGWLSSNDNIMFLCFLIGSVHITLAHGWSAIRRINSLQALAQVGWICTTWFMFFVIRTMVLGAVWHSYYFILLGMGVFLIAFFMTPWRSLKSEWFNHVMLPLDLISNFVDVVSYVRLFAVGLATFAVGNAFNNMAVGSGIHSVLAGFGAAAVLFVGHALNIVMAIMSVLVHGIRLNTLEFSGHLGMEWSGTKFEPFATRIKDTDGDKENVK